MSSKKKTDGDDRFLRVQKDPRFWEMPDRERKVKIDKRFQSMFHDERFKVKYTVDKRGRPINHTSTEDLKRFYKLSDSEEDEDEEEEEEADQRKNKPERGVRVIEHDEDDEEQQSTEEDADEDVTGSSQEEDDDEDEEEEEESGLDSGDDSDSEPDLARGKGNVETSSEDEDEDVDAVLRREEEEIQHDWGELCKDAPRSEQVSARLAVCNMDWDRMKAKDLLALLNSFCPPGGVVLSVKIYPSEFGKERLKVEETQGPLELRALPDDSEDDTEEERVHREKKRDYQFKRLKYFYAVVECDSVATSARIYEECDGYEYESSCSVLDLRFIPDDVTFDEEPKDVATDVNLTSYTPKLFTSSAAATSKVELTWDETDHERQTALSRTFNKNQLLDMDFNAYLASSSEDDEEEGGQEDADHGNTAEEELVVEKKPREEKKKKKSEEQISKYRELLRGIQDKEKKLQEDKDMEMEITWVPGLKEATEQLVKKKLEAKDKLTPWEEFLQKKKDRKKQKKSERKQGTDGEQLSDDELPPDVDLSDPFFSEELGAAELKKKKKQKKKQEEEPMAEEEEEAEKQKAQMTLLMDDDDGHKHFNYDKIVEQQNLSKKKRKKLLKKNQELPEDDDFQVDVKDPRFQAMFTSHLFNLDPSHPSYRRTQATHSILAEKQRRREEEQRRTEDALAARKATPTQAESAGQQEAAGKRRQNELDAPTARKAMDPSLSLLVKSIKNKTEQFQARKKQKLL